MLAKLRDKNSLQLWYIVQEITKQSKHSLTFRHSWKLIEIRVKRSFICENVRFWIPHLTVQNYFKQRKQIQIIHHRLWISNGYHQCSVKYTVVVMCGFLAQLWEGAVDQSDLGNGASWGQRHTWHAPANQPLSLYSRCETEETHTHTHTWSSADSCDDLWKLLKQGSSVKPALLICVWNKSIKNCEHNLAELLRKSLLTFWSITCVSNPKKKVFNSNRTKKAHFETQLLKLCFVRCCRWVRVKKKKWFISDNI